MQHQMPRPAGWHDLDEGTAYWDGSRWTGDFRPPRRSTFAAVAHHRGLGCSLVAAGIAMFVYGMASFWNHALTPWGWNDAADDSFVGELSRVIEPESGLVVFSQALATFAICLIAAAALVAGGIYGLRGRGPTTSAVRQRLAQERREERAGQWGGAVLAIALNAVAAGQHRRSIERLSVLRELEEMRDDGRISEDQFEAERDRLFPG